jgi:signal transduction histidine kinase
MTLRSRLALALAAGALLPMAVALAVPLARVESAAREETDRRLAAAHRQAQVVVARERAETALRLDRAAAGLASDRALLAAVLAGPEAAARTVARTLAERHGLDLVEVSGPQRTVLSTWGASPAAGAPSALADVPSVGTTLRRYRPAEGDEAQAVGLFASRRAAVPGERLDVAGGRGVGRALLAEIAALTGAPVALLDPAGEAVLAAGGSEGTKGVPAVVAIDGGWSVRVEAPVASAARLRADLFAGAIAVAPFALVASIAAGFFIAGRIARPIADLAARADAIAAERGGPFALLPESDEVVRLRGSFERMLDALEQSERERVAAQRVAAWQEVARRVAHEVRNALSPIQLAVANLRRTHAQAPARIERALVEEGTAILEEVESLKRLVDEFSEFARLPAPRLAPCDLAAAARQAAGLFAGRLARAGVVLDLDLDQAARDVSADGEQIGRVFKNVIANALDALEAAPAGRERRVTVSLRGASIRGAPAVSIEVRDNGVGMEVHAVERVFEPYYTSRAERGGTGLGLAIAHRIVSEHAGTIRAQSQPGRGASFTIVLPVAGPPAARN